MSAAEMSRRRFALLLASTPGIGSATLTRILVRADLIGCKPAQFLRLSPEALREEFSLTEPAISALSGGAAPLIDRAAKLEDRLDKLGVALVTVADATFPARLEELGPPLPGALYVYGNQRLLRAKTFCVLSSRNTAPAGLAKIEELAEAGVLASEVLVTGHNKPEYQRSAIVPLRWGAPRILCLDRGLFPTLGDDLSEEPFAAARLWRYKFDPMSDLVVSPFRPEAAFGRVTNQVRDRLAAGLSDRLDFVAIRPGGNMDRLARAALRAKRVVRICDLTENCAEFEGLGAEVIRT